MWGKRFRNSRRTWGGWNRKKGSSEAAVRLDAEPARRGSEGGDGGPATRVQ
jgi:hypothetical protein